VPPSVDESQLSRVAPTRPEKIVIQVLTVSLAHQMVSMDRPPSISAGDISTDPSSFRISLQQVTAYLDRGLAEPEMLAAGKILEINCVGTQGETTDTGLITVRNNCGLFHSYLNFNFFFNAASLAAG